MNEWLTMKEAMNYLRVTSRTTAYEILYRNNILVNKTTRKILINFADLKEKMKAKTFRLGI